MQESVTSADGEMIDDVFIQHIPLYYGDYAIPVVDDADPEICFGKIITALTMEYTSNPAFTMENYNQEARKQMRKYNMIWKNMNRILDKVLDTSEQHVDDLKKFFYETDINPQAEDVFKKLLSKDFDEGMAKKEIYE